MKRSELKRKTPLRSSRAPFQPAAGKGLRKTRIRRKSKRKRKWQNPVAWEKYRREHPWCELTPLFPSRAKGIHRIPLNETGEAYAEVQTLSPTDDLHHLGSCVGGTPRWDRPFNLIAASRVSHEWAERFASDGLVLCLYAKLLSDSLDYERLSKITHVVFPSYLETLELKFDFCREIRAKLLEVAA